MADGLRDLLSAIFPKRLEKSSSESAKQSIITGSSVFLLYLKERYGLTGVDWTLGCVFCRLLSRSDEHFSKVYECDMFAAPSHFFRRVHWRSLTFLRCTEAWSQRVSMYSLWAPVINPMWYPRSRYKGNCLLVKMLELQFETPKIRSSFRSGRFIFIFKRGSLHTLVSSSSGLLSPLSTELI